MPKHFPATLFLPRDALHTQDNQPLGRRVAGRHFATSLAKILMPGEVLTAVTTSGSDAVVMDKILRPLLAPNAGLRILKGFSLSKIQETGALHFPGPDIADWCQLRPRQQAQLFSITGVIHTLSSKRALTSLEDLLLAPLHPWDALVCTSTAGRSVVERCLEARLELLRHRFHQPDLSCPNGPELPVIPLPLQADQPISPNLDRNQRRRRGRRELGIPEEAFVVCFVGRLSFHSKAHPLPLYRALERLAEECPEVILLECGHLFNDAVEDAYNQVQSHFPRLKFFRVGGREPASETEKWLALAAADVFTSPADNLQETFGISLLEGMAAELPLVVSDWNGYRDLVQHGVNGILVPTSDVLLGFTEPDATEISYRLGFLDYDTWVGMRAMGVVVDEDALYQAFKLLLLNPQKRNDMAQAGLRYLATTFGWDVVARQYRQLWDDLAERRRRASVAPVSMPLHVNYTQAFASYASTRCDIKAVQVEPGGTPASWLLDAMTASVLEKILGGRLQQVLNRLSDHPTLREQDLWGMDFSPMQARLFLSALVKLGVASDAEDA